MNTSTPPVGPLKTIKDLEAYNAAEKSAWHDLEQVGLALSAAAAEQRDADMGHNGYHQLADVLRRAYRQAATGKGAERHAQGQPFEAQPMQHLIGLYGVGFATGQAAKKAQESHRLPRERAVAELLGAINYLAGAVVAIEAGKTHHTD